MTSWTSGDALEAANLWRAPRRFPLVSISMQVSQFAHVVALPLERGADLVTDLDNPLLALAPTSERRHGRDRGAFLHNE
jgi:hypothetical protein